MSDRPLGRPVDRRSSGWSRRFVAALIALGTMAAAACDQAEPTRTADEPDTVRLYGSDGNMTSSFGGTFKDQADLLNGMRGTSPLTPLPEDFKRRLRAVDPRADQRLPLRRRGVRRGGHRRARGRDRAQRRGPADRPVHDGGDGRQGRRRRAVRDDPDLPGRRPRRQGHRLPRGEHAAQRLHRRRRAVVGQLRHAGLRPGPDGRRREDRVRAAPATRRTRRKELPAPPPAATRRAEHRRRCGSARCCRRPATSRSPARRCSPACSWRSTSSTPPAASSASRSQYTEGDDGTNPKTRQRDRRPAHRRRRTGDHRCRARPASPRPSCRRSSRRSGC